MPLSPEEQQELDEINNRLATESKAKLESFINPQDASDYFKQVQRLSPEVAKKVHEMRAGEVTKPLETPLIDPIDLVPAGRIAKAGASLGEILPKTIKGVGTGLKKVGGYGVKSLTNSPKFTVDMGERVLEQGVMGTGRGMTKSIPSKIAKIEATRLQPALSKATQEGIEIDTRSAINELLQLREKHTPGGFIPPEHEAIIKKIDEQIEFLQKTPKVSPNTAREMSKVTAAYTEAGEPRAGFTRELQRTKGKGLRNELKDQVPDTTEAFKDEEALYKFKSDIERQINSESGLPGMLKSGVKGAAATAGLGPVAGPTAYLGRRPIVTGASQVAHKTGKGLEFLGKSAPVTAASKLAGTAGVLKAGKLPTLEEFLGQPKVQNSSPLSPDEEAELAELQKRFGK